MIMHKCNVCNKKMKPVNDINLEGFLIRGWRCECGNEIKIQGDVDKIQELKNGISGAVDTWGLIGRYEG